MEVEKIEGLKRYVQLIRENYWISEPIANYIVFVLDEVIANEPVAKSTTSAEVAGAIADLEEAERSENRIYYSDNVQKSEHELNVETIWWAITALQAYQLPSAIKWTGDNLREVISLTGWHESAKSKWTWEEYEQVVKEKGLKIFTPDGAVIAAIGSWIVRDGSDCLVLQAYEPWVSVEAEKPESGKHVLLCCEIRPSGKRYVCDGYYAQEKSITSGYSDEWDCEYDEETDEYYLTEGYYEIIKNWGDYSSIAIDDFVTHYLPLPEPPKGE